MFGDGALTFREFVMNEPVPLAIIHRAVLEFLRGRDDVVLFGAQAVNAYVDEPRMTQDVDVAALHAKEFAEEVRGYLNAKFHLAIRIREIKGGIGYRVYQLSKPENRHLVDVRAVAILPPHQQVEEVPVVQPVELVCQKLLSWQSRRQSPKGIIDHADLLRLLITFPELKSATGPVPDRLAELSRDAQVAEAWRTLAAEEIEPDDPESGW